MRRILKKSWSDDKECYGWTANGSISNTTQQNDVIVLLFTPIATHNQNESHLELSKFASQKNAYSRDMASSSRDMASEHASHMARREHSPLNAQIIDISLSVWQIICVTPTRTSGKRTENAETAGFLFCRSFPFEFLLSKMMMISRISSELAKTTLTNSAFFVMPASRQEALFRSLLQTVLSQKRNYRASPRQFACPYFRHTASRLRNGPTDKVVQNALLPHNKASQSMKAAQKNASWISHSGNQKEKTMMTFNIS